MLRRILPLCCVFVFAGCLNVKVQPIHVVVDVNVKVDQALDNFFGDLDKKSATITTGSTPAKP